MSVEFDRGSPGKFDSRTLNRKTLNRWTGRTVSSFFCLLSPSLGEADDEVPEAAGRRGPGGAPE